MDSRFWKLYTVEKSDKSKQIVNKMIKCVKNGLDRTWFPVELQKEISTMEEFRDLGIKYKADEVFSSEYIERI